MGKNAKDFIHPSSIWKKCVLGSKMWDGMVVGIWQQGEANHTSHFDIDIYPEMSKKQIRYLQLQQSLLLAGLFLNSFEKPSW